MNQIFVFIIGFVLGALAIWLATKASKGAADKPDGPIRQAQDKQKNLEGFNEKRRQEVEANKQKIMDLLEKSPNGQITNNQAQDLIGFSDASAERYLDDLEKEGKIRQVGKTGEAVFYIKN
jgi:Fic family protein